MLPDLGNQAEMITVNPARKEQCFRGVSVNPQWQGLNSKDDDEDDCQEPQANAMEEHTEPRRAACHNCQTKNTHE